MHRSLRFLHVMEIPEDDKLREWNQLALLERIQNDFMINTSEKLRYIEHLQTNGKYKEMKIYNMTGIPIYV